MVLISDLGTDRGETDGKCDDSFNTIINYTTDSDQRHGRYSFSLDSPKTCLFDICLDYSN